MCGRLNQFAKLKSLSIAGKVLNLERRKKKPREDRRAESHFIHNICPTDYAEVVTLENDELTLEPMRFGLVPQWAKGSKAEVWRKFMLTFNARCETVFDLASYRHPIRKHRCLVPVCGWHEWPERSTPYYIHRADDEPILLAGIWDVWESHHLGDEESGVVVTSMSVITTPPGPYMAKFHDRSPLMLDGANALAWLQPGTNESDIRALLHPVDDDHLEAHRVSTAVNSARNKTDEVLRAIAPPVPHGDVPAPANSAKEDLMLF